MGRIRFDYSTMAALQRSAYLPMPKDPAHSKTPPPHL